MPTTLRRGWLTRIVWLSAWLLWAVNGIFFYRNLPLDFGPLLAKLPIENDDRLGFVQGESLFVTLANDEDQEHRLVRVWDVRNAILLHEWPAPVKVAYAWSPVHGCLLFESRSEDSPKPASLNVKTGEWRSLACTATYFSEDHVSFHDTRPWSVFWGKADGDRISDFRQQRIVVVDFATGAVIGKLPPRSKQVGKISYLSKPLFVPGTENLVVGAEDEATHRPELQIWRIPLSEKPLRAFPGRLLLDDPVFSSNQRVAWHDRGVLPHSVDVLDLNSGEILFSHPPASERKQLADGEIAVWPGPVLAADGQTVFQSITEELWDVSTGKRLGSFGSSGRWDSTLADPNGRIEHSKRLQDQSWIAKWNEWIGKRIPRLMVEGDLYSVYDLRSGTLLYRCRQSTVQDGGGPYLTRLADGLLVERDGSAYDLPPRVVWGWIAGVQTVLAFPMLALWAWGRRTRDTKCAVGGLMARQ